MSIEQLLAEACPHTTERPKPRPAADAPARSQYRRTEDEDAGGLADVHFGPDGEVRLAHYERTGEVRYRPEPALAATVAAPVVPPDAYAGLDPLLVEVARPLVENFQAPIDPRALPMPLSDDARRAVLTCVYHLRHAHRMPLRLPGERPPDPRLPGWDLAKSIDRLCRLFREEVLARHGHRTLAHGVFPIDPKNPARGYRVQIWDTSKEKRNTRGEVVIGGKLHIAYKRTEEEAWQTLADWFLKHRGIDARKYLCYHPQSAIATLAGLMRKTAQAANEYVEIGVREVRPAAGTTDDWD